MTKKTILLEKVILILIVIIFSKEVFAKYEFSIENASPKYSALIEVDKCETDSNSYVTCEGPGFVSLIDKGTKVKVQKIKSKDFNLLLDKNFQLSAQVMELNEKQNPLIFGDFNFDGTEDVAISNGNKGQYRTASYDVYVFSTNGKKFILSKELTDLATNNLGMFEVDISRKRLIASVKSGCCWHQTTEYEVIPNKGLRSVYIKEEDAMGGEDVIVKESKWVNGKWEIKTQKYKIKDYYKD